MKSITTTALTIVEENKLKFFDEHGKNALDEKRLFIGWYIQNCKDDFNILIHDLSNYYLHISKDRIIRYLNEKG